jgi:2-oxo-hept-3-ene-1,7-dioate hydratase|tara:strand:- start:1796 stop:2599 length:804 start_codon:yes stop_codon:yes gene_type:complete
MLTQEQIEQAARDLDEAERSRTQTKPLTLNLPDMDMDDAYSIQKSWVDLKLARGAKVTGYKIGLTSRAMQQAMKIDTPDYGVLLDEMAFTNNASIPASDFLDPRIEAEFGFVMKRSLFGEAVTLEEVLDATDYVVPALELISARSTRTDPDTGYTRTVCDTIADNAANAGYIVGDTHIDPIKTDLRFSGALLYVDGVVEESGLGGAVMEHPGHGIRWVCKRFARHGIGLEAGQFVLSGSFTRPVPVQTGTKILADYGQLGKIEIDFT